MPDAADAHATTQLGHRVTAAIEHLGNRAATAAVLGELADDEAALRAFSSQQVRIVLQHLAHYMAAQRGLGLVPFELVGEVDDDLGSVPDGLAVETLGQVYEGLLNYEPNIVLEPTARFRLSPRGSARKSSGTYYTQPGLVKRILDSALQPVIDARLAQATNAEAALLSITVCDPACGSGAFLLGAADALAAALVRVRADGASLQDARRDVVRHCVHGVDVDPLAVEVCKWQLWLGAADPDLPATFLDEQVRCGDALLGEDVFDSAGYDVVVGNPPFVDSETLCAERPEYRQALAQSFETAQGNWDLYVPFLELAARLTKPGGRHALLTPRRFMASDYCAAIHRRYLTRRLREVVDCGDAELFGDASVRVSFVTVENAVPGPQHEVAFRTLDLGLNETWTTTVRQHDLRCLPPGYLAAPFRLTSPTLLRAIAELAPLQTVADCSDGATTAEAYRIRELLRDGAVAERVRLVNTGTIDPYRLRYGQRAIKYLGFSATQPTVDPDELHRVAPRRAEQARRWKVVVAGLARQIEAAVAPPGVLCGKSAVLVLPHDGICPHALAAWLNSFPIRELYRAVFGLRGFSSGSMNLGPRQLERLPVPEADELAEAGELSRLGREAHEAATGGGGAALAGVQARIDAMVSRLMSPDQTAP